MHTIAGRLLWTALALLAAPAFAAEPWITLDHDPRQMLGTLSCASASCHGRVEPLIAPGTVQRQEYRHYRGTDPHARASQRMLQPRYQEVLRRATEFGGQPAEVSARCAQCHDPLGVAGEKLIAEQGLSQVCDDLPLGRGIGCESCHGPAKGWLSAHYQRGISREELTNLGMFDTKQVLVRAQVCASCHAGSPGRDVNHDFYAAGHPPLRFELASHQASIERKHWNDAPRRQSDPNYEVQLWAAGRLAAADAALALLESRATHATSGGIWPEFAESNCQSCHRPLPAETGRSLGKLPWQSWNVANAPSLAREPAFCDALATLRTTMEDSFVPNQAAACKSAAAARTALRQQVRVAANGTLLTSEGASLGIAAALNSLNSDGDTLNWDQACQQLAAVLAVERSLADAGGPASPNRQSRLHQIASALGFPDTHSEWPRAHDKQSLAAVAAQLAELRRELTTAVQLQSNAIRESPR